MRDPPAALPLWPAHRPAAGALNAAEPKSSGYFGRFTQAAGLLGEVAERGATMLESAAGAATAMAALAVARLLAEHGPTMPHEGGCILMDTNVFLPTADHIARVMSQAAAPAFVLGAVAAFSSVLLGRMTSVIERIRSLNEISDEDATRGHLKSDIARLRRRVDLLRSATQLALASGVSVSLLLILGFLCAFFNLRHEFGAGFLFILTLGLLSVSLFRLGHEVQIGISEADLYR